MLYTITNSGVQNGRPTSVGTINISIAYAALYQYGIADFTTSTTPVYSDPENDPLSYIKVVTLPALGILSVSGVPLGVGAIVGSGAITAGNFKYEALQSGSVTGYSSSWSFDVADTGSNSLSGLTTGLVTMTVAESINLAPDVVGNRTEVLDYAESLVFSGAMFTTGTTPAYNDPEGDPAQSVKILDLPADGTLVFNGVDVVANQVVSIAEINLGYLIFNPNLATTTLQSLTFNFSVSDSGSGLFTQ
tara:strand:- start:24367 stop:25107 length:741 start_codon:yes stop_codon:yes gene_type:complete